jgi:hypothetical protein
VPVDAGAPGEPDPEVEGEVAPGEPDGSTEGLQDFLAPPSMSLFALQPPRQSLLYPARGQILSGEPFSATEKTRYWEQRDLRFVAEVTGNAAVAVKLGDRVAAGHLPNKYLLALKVVDLDRKFAGYQCPCGTFLTKSAE